MRVNNVLANLVDDKYLCKVSLYTYMVISLDFGKNIRFYKLNVPFEGTKNTRFV